MWDRLAALESFGFRLRYSTDVPFDIGAEFEGSWVAPDREHWSGHWLRAGEVTRAELVGAGTDQYQKQGGSWVPSPRGLETRIFEQAQSVLEGRTLTFLQEAGRSLQYEFVPELRFLDPGLSKQMKGELELDRRYGLPTRIECYEPDGPAQWFVKFGSFNRAGRIDVPFVPEVEFVLKADGWGGFGATGRALGIVGHRLNAIGEVHRLKRGWCSATLFLRRPLQRSLVELALSRGGVEVWSARRADGDSGPDEGRALNVGGDAAFRVRLDRRLAGGKELDAGVELEELPEPRLVVRKAGATFPELLADSAGLYVLVADDRALGATSWTRDGSLVFADIGARDHVRLVAAVVNSGPAPVGFRVAEERAR
jgi:hypothetical protein